MGTRAFPAGHGWPWLAQEEAQRDCAGGISDLDRSRKERKYPGESLGETSSQKRVSGTGWSPVRESMRALWCHLAGRRGSSERAPWRGARDPVCAATDPSSANIRAKRAGLGSCFDFSAKNKTIKPLRPFISLF